MRVVAAYPSWPMRRSDGDHGRRPTRSAGDHLSRVLRSLADQTLEPERYEVLVVDDGSPSSGHVDHWHDGERRRVVRQRRSGLAHARNLGLFMAASPVVLFLADDEVAAPGLLEEHVRAHASTTARPRASSARRRGRPTCRRRRCCTSCARVERLPLSYPDAPTDRCRTSPTSAPATCRSSVTSSPATPCSTSGSPRSTTSSSATASAVSGASTSTTGRRRRARGRRARRSTRGASSPWPKAAAIARLAATHSDDDVQGHCRIDAALEHWRRHPSEHAALRARIIQLQLDVGTDRDELWLAYRACFDLDRCSRASPSC